MNIWRDVGRPGDKSNSHSTDQAGTPALCSPLSEARADTWAIRRWRVVFDPERGSTT